MPGPDAPDTVFGPLRLNRQNRSLTRDGVAVPLGGRAFDTLAVLASAPSATVGKEALLDAVWPGLTVAENNLQVQVSALRKALGDGWIVTVPGRGYRLALPPPAAEPQAAPKPPDRPSIAVLPFQNLSGDPEQEYFADGMTEEIITALSRIRSFLVIARASSFIYKGRAVDVRQVGRELGVRYVVEGSVRKSGDRVRIAGQLADAASGVQLWADRFDSGAEDVFALQDRVAASLIGAIEPRIRTVEIDRAQRKPPGSLEAYDLVLRATPHLYIYDQADHAEAVRLLRQAIEMEPTYALALALLSRCAWLSVAAGWLGNSASAREEAVRLARLALAHGGDDPEVLAQTAQPIGLGGGDLDSGIALAERAFALNPNSILAITVVCYLAAHAGDIAKVMAYAERAERINPFEDTAHRDFTVAFAHFVTGQHEQVLTFTTKALRAQPKYIPPRRVLTASLGLLGRAEEARQSARQLLALAPETTVARARAHLEINTNNAIKVPGVVDAFCEGLRRAGIPES